MKLLIASVAGLLVVGQARADTIAIVCNTPAQAGDMRVVFNTNGWARVDDARGVHRYQARVTDDEIDFDVDRQPYRDVRYQIDRRTGVANLTIFSYRLNERTTAVGACRRTSESPNLF